MVNQADNRDRVKVWVVSPGANCTVPVNGVGVPVCGDGINVPV